MNTLSHHHSTAAVILTTCLAGALLPHSTARADIQTGGEINPPLENVTPTRALTIGSGGTGWMRIDGGSELDVRDGWIGSGFEGNGHGTVEVTGAGSRWNITESLRIGWGAYGELNILDGGAVFAETARIGADSHSDGYLTVDGIGSQMILAGNLTIGRRGTGSMTVSNGGYVENHVAALGREGFAGHVVVTGEGSHWHNHGGIYMTPLQLGLLDVPGISTLTISDGGLISSDHSLYAMSPVEGGAVRMDGGFLELPTAVITSQNLIGVGTIDADHWLLDGTHTITNSAVLPGQIVMDSLPGQNITVNIAWSEAGGELSRFGVDNGDVVLAGGTVLTSLSSTLGLSPESLGIMTVTGSGTSWNMTGGLGVGTLGAGELHIEDGGAASSVRPTTLGAFSGSSGLVTISGADSSWTVDNVLYIGKMGDGEVLVADGASLSTPGRYGTVVGDVAGSTGRVTVTGAGSSWVQLEQGTQLSIGRRGEGEVLLSDGATMITDHIEIGFEAQGLLTVTGDGSALSSNRNSILQVRGLGAVRVEDGGSISVTRLLAGTSYAGNARIYVDGPGSSLTVLEDIMVGMDYAPDPGRIGAVFVSNGATLNAGWVVIAESSGQSFLDLDHATVNTGWGLIPNESLRGTGTINADHWLLDGVHILQSPGDLPAQMRLQNTLGQDIAINLAWGDITQMEVSGVDSGDVTIGNGLMLTAQDGFVGYSPGAVGRVTVEGTDTLWRSRDTLHIGYFGAGELVLRDGATVMTDHLDIGSSQPRIANSGAVSVSGADTLLDADYIRLGRWRGTGSLTVNTGARVSSRSLEIGDTNGGAGSVVIDGIGTTYSVATGIVVESPDDGESTFELTGGASLYSYGLSLYSADGSVAIARISGAGTHYAGTSISVGSRGHAELWITDGAVVTGINGTGTLGRDPGSSGKVVVDGAGSSWSLSHDLRVGQDGAGELHITHGGRVMVVGDLQMGIGGQLHLSVGSASEASLAIGGDASLAGTLSLSTAEGFASPIGSEFLLISIDDNRTGFFDSMPEGAVALSSEGIDFMISYHAGDGNDIAVSLALSGDINGDGTVGAVDLDFLLANWGESVAPYSRLAGDLSGDGIVGDADLQIVINNWGNTTPHSEEVPEPGTLASLLALLCILPGRRRMTYKSAGLSKRGRGIETGSVRLCCDPLNVRRLFELRWGLGSVT